MALVDYLKDGLARTKASFSSDRDKFIDYMTSYGLKDYFSEEIPEEERQRLRSSLEDKLNYNLERYKKELGGIVRKSASKGTMGLVIANDLYTYLSNNPIANATGFAYAMFAIKTAAELPALYRYIKKTHDWYGAADIGKYMLMKPLRYFIPIIGPAIEAGAFERMVRKRVLKETMHEFIKEHGDYQSFEERLKEKLKSPIYKSIEMPEKIAA